VTRLAVRVLGLSIIIPALATGYLFRDQLPGKEIPLFLILVLAGLGFYFVWKIMREVSEIQKGLVKLARGESASLGVDSDSQLHEVSEIADTLGRMTSEFRENANQLEGLVDQFSSLTELAELSADVPNVEELLRLVLHKAMSVTQAQRGSVMLLRENRQVFDVVVTEGWDGEACEPIPVKDSLVQQVVSTGRPLLIDNIENALDPQRSNDATRYQSPSFLIMPLRTQTETLGAVCLAEKSSGGCFETPDEQFLTVLVGQIGYVIENERILERARTAAQRLLSMTRQQESRLHDQLDSLGQLAGGIAHDFNNLVHSILGYTRFAMERLEPEGKPYNDLKKVEKAAERAADLTRQLQAFGRSQPLQTADLDLNTLVDIVVEKRGAHLGSHIEIQTHLAQDLGPVHADRALIEQVLVNLMDNARDAMPGGGTITIETENVVTDDITGSRSSSTLGPYVLITVTDVGFGMDAETSKRAFEPFFTTKEEGTGSGLGLATAYGIVKQHGGVIDLVSEESKGTTFSIYLPTTVGTEDANAVPENADPRVEVEVHGGTETILVVDDEDAVRELSSRVLESAGYTVLSASDGEHALEMFQAHSAHISLALVDAVMPGVDGHEVCRQIRSKKPDTRLILSTGYSAEATKPGVLEKQGLRLLRKPFEPGDLLTSVREALDEAA